MRKPWITRPATIVLVASISLNAWLAARLWNRHPAEQVTMQPSSSRTAETTDLTAKSNTQALEPAPIRIEPRAKRAAASAQASTTASAPVGGSVELGPAPPEPVSLPTDRKELLEMLERITQELKHLLDDGLLAAMYKPAFDAKDVLLALSDYDYALTDAQREVTSNAMHVVLISTWQIDTLGDQGDKQKVSAVHDVFQRAVSDARAAYGSIQ